MSARCALATGSIAVSQRPPTALDGPAREATRYWFIDEITSTQGGWWSVIKDLRDNTSFGDDCVVLTGSSNRNLDEAIKAFAGRRGLAIDPDRCLLPMTFRQFCASLGAIDRSIAAVRPDELRSGLARDVWQSLVPVTDDLVAAWQAYLEVGGYPKAVSDWRARNHIEPSTWGALWERRSGRSRDRTGQRSSRGQRDGRHRTSADLHIRGPADCRGPRNAPRNAGTPSRRTHPSVPRLALPPPPTPTGAPTPDDRASCTSLTRLWLASRSC